jgi:hypothetical protein
MVAEVKYKCTAEKSVANTASAGQRQGSDWAQKFQRPAQICDSDRKIR